jgi:hypothetical protein
MTTEDKKTIDLSTIDCSKAKAIWVCPLGTIPDTVDDSVWVFNPDKTISTHCPEDRCGGPFGLFAVVNPGDCGERWFIFAVVDSHFPVRELVRADSFEDAYEIYVDHAAEHWHCKIEESDMKDYLNDAGEYEGAYDSSGNPVDTDSIQGCEVRLMRIDF